MLQYHWHFSDFVREEETLCSQANGTLFCTEEDFVSTVCDELWKTFGYVSITIEAICLETIPSNIYNRHIDKYKLWEKAKEK